jgi:hypothetical protein
VLQRLPLIQHRLPPIIACTPQQRPRSAHTFGYEAGQCTHGAPNHNSLPTAVMEGAVQLTSSPCLLGFKVLLKWMLKAVALLYLRPAPCSQG